MYTHIARKLGVYGHIRRSGYLFGGGADCINDIYLPLLEKYSEIKCVDSKKAARSRHAALAAACFSGLCRHVVPCRFHLHQILLLFQPHTDEYALFLKGRPRPATSSYGLLPGPSCLNAENVVDIHSVGRLLLYFFCEAVSSGT
jgi:hypothetical protein